jgi:hypothetical protein
MPKKDKKNHQQQKLEQVHQKNLYLQKLKAMMGVIGDQSAYNLLSQNLEHYLGLEKEVVSYNIS